MWIEHLPLRDEYFEAVAWFASGGSWLSTGALRLKRRPGEPGAAASEAALALKTTSKARVEAAAAATAAAASPETARAEAAGPEAAPAAASAHGRAGRRAQEQLDVAVVHVTFVLKHKETGLVNECR